VSETEQRTAAQIRQALAEAGSRPMRVIPADRSELGPGLHLREMTTRQADAWEEAWSEYRRDQGHDDNEMSGWRAVLLLHTLCDASGTLALGPKDAEMLLALPMPAIKRLYLAAARLNGIIESQSAEKNSADTPGG